jgi:hypothetical protein
LPSLIHGRTSITKAVNSYAAMSTTEEQWDVMSKES